MLDVFAGVHHVSIKQVVYILLVKIEECLEKSTVNLLALLSTTLEVKLADALLINTGINLGVGFKI